MQDTVQSDTWLNLKIGLYRYLNKKKIFLRRNVNNKSTRHNQMVPESELKIHL